MSAGLRSPVITCFCYNKTTQTKYCLTSIYVMAVSLTKYGQLNQTKATNFFEDSATVPSSLITRTHPGRSTSRGSMGHLM